MNVYLDHAATTPMLPEAVAAVADRLGGVGNPSSLHAAGRAARRVVEDGRERVAAFLGAHPTEVLLTSGGTEADNLAVVGLYRARRAADDRRRVVAVSAVEHHAVLDPARRLAEREGAETVELPVDAEGVVEVAALAELLAARGDEVACVSVMWANNEVGAVQPVAEVVALAAAHGVPVHADAVQAVGQLPVDLAASGLAALTVTGHKVGGPVGTGALLLRRGVRLEPVLHGGGHERGLRPGTLDAAGVAGFAVAVELAVARREAAAARLAGLRDALWAAVRAAAPDAVLRGPGVVGVVEAGTAGAGGVGVAGLRVPDGPRVPAGPDRRLPANLHVTIPGCDGDALLYLLDAAGIAVSTGSACQAGVAQPSHVLLAMGVGEREARGALRLTLGHTSSEADVAALAAALPEVVARARAAAGAG